VILHGECHSFPQCANVETIAGSTTYERPDS
jgi:hypothetical protein